MQKQIYKNQTEEDYLICNYHQRHLIESESLKAKVYYFSTQQEVDGIYVKDGYITFKGFRLIHKDDLVLPGEHNLEKYTRSCVSGTISRGFSKSHNR